MLVDPRNTCIIIHVIHQYCVDFLFLDDGWCYRKEVSFTVKQQLFLKNKLKDTSYVLNYLRVKIFSCQKLKHFKVFYQFFLSPEIRQFYMRKGELCFFETMRRFRISNIGRGPENHRTLFHPFNSCRTACLSLFYLWPPVLVTPDRLCENFDHRQSSVCWSFVLQHLVMRTFLAENVTRNPQTPSTCSSSLLHTILSLFVYSACEVQAIILIRAVSNDELTLHLFLSARFVNRSPYFPSQVPINCWVDRGTASNQGWNVKANALTTIMRFNDNFSSFLGFVLKLEEMFSKLRFFHSPRFQSCVCWSFVLQHLVMRAFIAENLKLLHHQLVAHDFFLIW